MKISKENIVEKFGTINDFSAKQKTFSPFCSNIGIEVNPDAEGTGALWLHYNRASRKTWNNIVSFPLKQNKAESSAFEIVYGEKEKTAYLTFCDTDTIFFHSENLSSVELFAEKDKMLHSYWIKSFSEDAVEICGYSFNADDRDPDETVPFYIYIKTICGKINNENNITVSADNNQNIAFVFLIQILDIDEEAAKKRIEISSKNYCEAKEKCKQFYLNCFEDFSLEINDENEEKIIAKAAYGLTANLAKAPGRLKEHISSYPSRGTYPTHFLWDTCFQNLAYEELSMPLAKEFLLQIANYCRSDGKFPQFMCSTWERPHYSQPALVGWATLRIAEKDNDRAFIEKMLDAIEKNNKWWLNSRGSECGLISCPHGLETGQDDSPRFDNGTTFACDMNSYVLHQLHCAAKLNEILGNNERKKYWEEKAEKLSQKIIEFLWCEEDGIFYDVRPDDMEFVKIVSPVSFLPLWAGVNLDKEKADTSIKKYLLNPEYLFGEVPFPSVAYNDLNYGSDKWWRGPTWMPNAYLMLETLLKSGYKDEYFTSVKRLYNVMLKDKEMHELFDSKTGKGLGAAEQGWTNAIFIKLCKILNEG